MKTTGQIVIVITANIQLDFVELLAFFIFSIEGIWTKLDKQTSMKIILQFVAKRENWQNSFSFYEHKLIMYTMNMFETLNSISFFFFNYTS